MKYNENEKWKWQWKENDNVMKWNEMMKTNSNNNEEMKYVMKWK